MKKIHPEQKFLLFQEIELSCGYIKTILIIFQRKVFAMFQKNGTLSYFCKTESCTSHPIPQILKKSTQENSLYFQKWNFQVQILKKFLYFFKRKLFLYSPKRKLFLYFRKWSFLALVLKEFSIYFQNKYFFIFPKKRTLHFSAKALKIKEFHCGNPKNNLHLIFQLNLFHNFLIRIFFIIKFFFQ